MPMGRGSSEHIEAELRKIDELKKRIAARKTIAIQGAARRLATLKDNTRKRLIQLDIQKSAIMREGSKSPMHIIKPLQDGKKKINALIKKHKRTKQDETELAFLEIRIPQLEQALKKHTEGEPTRRKKMDEELAEVEKHRKEILNLMTKLLRLESVIKEEQAKRAPKRWV